MTKTVVAALLLIAGSLFVVDAGLPGPGDPAFLWFPGNEIDAGMNLWLLERNRQLVLGMSAWGLQSIFTTRAFWPEQNTLAWSDNWLMATPIFSVLRLMLPSAQAFAALVACSVAGNALACYRLARHGSVRWWPRVAGAGLASLSLTIVARIGHAQLMPAFAGVLAIDALLTAASEAGGAGIRRLNRRTLLRAFAWLQLQLALGFYLGVFFMLAAMCLLACHLVQARVRQGQGQVEEEPVQLTGPWRRWLIVNAGLLLFNGAVYLQHARAARMTGTRPWHEVSLMIPRAWSYGYNAFATAQQVSMPAPVQYGESFPGPFWEHSMFPGYAFAAAVLLGMRYWPALRQSHAIAILMATCGLLMLLTLGVGGRDDVWSLWYALYEWVPGMSAVRAVARIGVVLSLVAAPVLSAGLDHFAMHRDGRLRMARWMALGAVWAASGLTVPNDHRVDTVQYDSRMRASSQRIAELVRSHGCEAFYVAAPAGSDVSAAARWQLMVMWGSLGSGVPTVNGYSGHFPGGGWSPSMDADRLAEYLAGKGVSRSIRDRTCWFAASDVVSP